MAKKSNQKEKDKRDSIKALVDKIMASNEISPLDLQIRVELLVTIDRFRKNPLDGKSLFKTVNFDNFKNITESQKKETMFEALYWLKENGFIVLDQNKWVITDLGKEFYIEFCYGNSKSSFDFSIFTKEEKEILTMIDMAKICFVLDHFDFEKVYDYIKSNNITWSNNSSKKKYRPKFKDLLALAKFLLIETITKGGDLENSGLRATYVSNSMIQGSYDLVLSYSIVSLDTFETGV